MKQKNKIILLFILIVGIIGCDRFSPVDPVSSKVEGRSILLNPNMFHPEGIDTLKLNVGQTLPLGVISLIKGLDANYSWSSENPEILEVKPAIDKDGNELDEFAISNAKGNEGQTTTLTIEDDVNNIVKKVPVKIVKYWADPEIFEKIGDLNGHHYYLSKHRFNWLQSREICAMFGEKGHLVTLNSLEENSLIQNKLDEDAWIGMTFLYENDPLKNWITGEEIKFENWYNRDNPSLPGYKPSVGMQYYFIYMRADGFWRNDVVQTKKFILEFDQY